VATLNEHLAIAEIVCGWIDPQQHGAIGEQCASWDAAAWEAARWATQVHGIGPLLAECLRHSGSWSLLATEFTAYLEEQYRLNGQRSAILLGDLQALSEAAEDSGVVLVPLKGAALASRFYTDPALRPLADLDLLIRPQDGNVFDALLLKLGYQRGASTERHQVYTCSPQGKIVSTRGEHPHNPRSVELHHQLIEAFWGIRYDMTAAAWQGITTITGVPGKHLLPDRLLEHLLIHCATDLIACKARLIRLYDIRLVAAHVDDQGWQRMVSNAEGQGQQRLLYASLVLAERYHGQIAPRWVIDQLGRGTPTALCRYLAEAPLAQMALTNPVAASIRQKLSWFQPGVERWGALRAMLFPTPHELHEKNPHVSGAFAFAHTYVEHYRRMAAWPVRFALGLPRRAWMGRERGGDQ
jgi:hypothetical protein